jgi:anti-sigma factor RsiW
MSKGRKQMRSVIPEVCTHESDDVLEAYVRGHLSAADLERVEIHLLWCEACITRATADDVFIRAIRSVLKEESIDGEQVLSSSLRTAEKTKAVAEHVA